MPTLTTGDDSRRMLKAIEAVICFHKMKHIQCAAGGLECGSLLPLLSRELARALARHLIAARGQQAGLRESGSKLPHS